MAAAPLPSGQGRATGVGSLPGTDPWEAARTVLGELPDLPHLPELPGRGPGADMIGRACALLVDLHVDLQPSGWRLVDRAGADERRARSYLSADLDAFEEAAQDHRGPVKVQVAGPWTLSAALQLPRGEPALSDDGAWRDLLASLAEGVAAHVRDVRRRLPDCEVVLQVDEPSLPTVLAGRIRTMSGLRTLPPVTEHVAESGLKALVDAAGVPTVAHCCASSPPVSLLHRAGAGAVSVDLTTVGRALDEELGELLEAGGDLLAGVVPAVDPAGGASAGGPEHGPEDGPEHGREMSDATATVEPVRRLWQRLGLPPELLATKVVVTPTCGLAGASPRYARAALRLARSAAAVLVDDPEG